MTNIAAVLWDMDGVLADTSQLHYETWKTLLDAQGIKFDKHKFSRMFGRNNYDSLTILYGYPPSPEQLAWVDATKETAFRLAVPGGLQLLPGVQFWLESFQNHQLSQVVASSAPPENIAAVVAALGISHFFNDLVSAHHLPGKPDPAVFLEAARRVNYPPQVCLVIEDTPVGVTAARQAGMFCVAVCTTHPAQLLWQAHLVLPTLESLTWEILFQSTQAIDLMG
jgi:beta-phosphoglucomutase